MQPTTYQRIAVYLGITLVLSWAMQAYILHSEGTIFTLKTFIVMWIPGLVALGCSKYYGYNFGDLGIEIPEIRHLIWAYAVPAVASLVILFLLIILGIGEFAFYGWVKMLRLVIVSTTFGVLMAGLAALGEELGWRGFLHGQIRRTAWPHPYVITGFIWAVWHWPMILFGDYATSKLPLLSLALFTIMICSFSVFLGKLRDESQSIAPVILAHAAHNTWIQVIYPGFYKAGPLDPYFGGESGFLLAILYTLLALYLTKTADR